MCKTKLMPQWTKVLAGVAICTLVGMFAASDGWAAMCMVGYSQSKCNTSAPAATPNQKPCTGSNCCTGANCDPIPVDCERLGYKLYAAKPNNAEIWPTKALKNGHNDTANWMCDPCKKGNDIVYEKNYARYNCYQLCKNPDEATNVKGSTGGISNWFTNTENPLYTSDEGSISRSINAKYDSSRAADSTNSRRVYRDQFVLTPDDCKIIGGTTTVNGKKVPKLAFQWVTTYICGKCGRKCDGTEITAGCYKPCANPYRLEDGTLCCNQTTLTLMNANVNTLTAENKIGKNLIYAVGGKEAWHTPRYADVQGGCFDIIEEDTAADGSTCYREEPKNCGLCTKTDSACACVAKTCEDFASEANKPYGEGDGKVVDMSGRAQYNGNIKIGGVCYVPSVINDDCDGDQTSNDGTSTTVPTCALLNKLVCPDGSNGDDECSCGIGCPSGYAQMDKPGEAGYSSTLNSNYSINLQPYKVGTENKKSCVKLADDGFTCAPGYEVQCYKWIECSNVAGFLTGDGSGGCECDRSSGFYPVGESTDCPIPEATSLGACTITANGNAQPCKNTTYETLDGDNVTKHDQTTPVGKITCHYEPSVVCDYSYQADEYYQTLDGPYSCQCRCKAGYYSDTDPIPNCAICQRSDGCDPNAKEDYAVYAEVKSGFQGHGWIGTDNVAHPFGCYQYEEVNCDAYSGNGVLVSDGSCGCQCGNGWTDEDRTIDPNTETKTSESGSYTDTSGHTQTLTCYKYGTKSCPSGTVLTDEGCKSCSDYTDEQSSSDCGCGKKVVQTVEHKYQGTTVLTCYKCGNDDPKTCEDAGFFTNNTTPIPNGDNDWWCELEDAGTCVAWKDGEAISCYKGKTPQSSMSLGPCPNNGQGYHNDECLTSEIKINRCLHRCQERWQCVSYQCPRYTASTCSGEGKTFALSKVSTCINEGQGFCIIDGKYCKTTTEAADGTCRDTRDDE